ncbi:MAG: NAD-dependent epimerase/dehydratase family protein [Syntrophomonadaceae bacterium]
MNTILVTGVAGFIASSVASILFNQGYLVIGIDNLNDYYDRSLKLHRLSILQENPAFTFYRLDIENYDALELVFKLHKITAVVNLAARAGVRYSIKNPFVYFSTNSMGTLNLLYLCQVYSVGKFLLASTSSLYAGHELPFQESLPVNQPVSPYAASKKAAEAIAYSYHHLYGIDVTVLRYFTVYGPAGRPDMSIFLFIHRLMNSAPLTVFGDGTQSRDFTYIDDIARGTVMALSLKGYEVVNLGGNHQVHLHEVIQLLEEYTGKKAEITFREFHKADLKETHADISKAAHLMDWHPETGIEEGLKRTVHWFKTNWSWVKNIKM